ncbi:MAG: M67 family metallopeptidase [Kiritimatiellota bacterium]|nr:M67 family metallopeptidase [Kiritimatiellota bacterium]
MRKSSQLTIAQDVWDKLVATARKAAPLEACGLLAGMDGRVTKFYPTINMDASPEHFSMKPEEQFTAVKDMRRMGLKMLAIWHSHPSTPPRMSAEDLRLAFTPDVAHVILSLAQDANPECRAFVINSRIPQSVEVVITNE